MTFSAYDAQNQEITLPQPIEWEIVKSFDSPAKSFEGVFPYARAYPELFSVEVRDGTRRLFKGQVDETSMVQNDTGLRLTVLARGAGAILLDNEALPRIHINMDLNDMYNTHIRPYGVLPLVSDVAGDVFINTYQIQKGTSEWEAFSNFFRNAGYGTAYVNDNDQLVCRSYDPPITTHQFSNLRTDAIHFASLKVTNNRYSPITKFVIRDLQGDYSYVFDNPDSSLGLTRRRYLIPSIEYNQSPTGGTIDASLRVRRSMLGKKVITITVPGFLDAALCDNALIETGYETISNLFIHQVRYRMSEGGLVTTLTLLNRYYK